MRRNEHNRFPPPSQEEVEYKMGETLEKLRKKVDPVFEHSLRDEPIAFCYSCTFPLNPRDEVGFLWDVVPGIAFPVCKGGCHVADRT